MQIEIETINLSNDIFFYLFLLQVNKSRLGIVSTAMIMIPYIIAPTPTYRSYTKIQFFQVSVERLFSSLKIFKSDRRSRLKEDILNALLFLKSNM